jgi:nucleoside-diphosphate-sugar epimerase
MRILITGASGFIGSKLCNELVGAYSVRAFVRKGSITKNLDPKIEIVFGNLLDIQSIEKAISNVDVIYNLAAALPNAKLNNTEYFKINGEGTKNLLEASNKSKKIKQFIHCSTAFTSWGETPFVNEENKCLPETVYEKSKFEGEKAVKSMIGKTKFPITIIKPGLVYSSKSTFLYAIFKSLEKQRFFYVGGGKNLFEMNYVQDIINLLKNVLLNEKAYNDTFIISQKNPKHFNEIVEKSAKLLKVSPPKYNMPKEIFKTLLYLFLGISKVTNINSPINMDTYKTLTRNRAFDVSKALKKIGYNPKMTIENGLAQAVKEYEKQKMHKST